MTQQTTPTSPVDKVLAEIAIAMQSWSAEQVDKVGSAVRMRLDEHRDNVLMNLMGFEKDTWRGRDWRIDHCNGRNGNSIAGTFFAEAQKQALQEWLAQIPLPKMTPAFKNKITKDLQSMYVREIENNAYSRAKQMAQNDLTDLLKVVLEPKTVDMHLKLQELINPPAPPTTIP